MGATIVLSLACLVPIPGPWAPSSYSDTPAIGSPQIVDGSKVTVHSVLFVRLAEVYEGSVRSLFKAAMRSFLHWSKHSVG